MISRRTSIRRSFLTVLIATLTATLFVHPASAQMREQMKMKVVNDVANEMVSKIQNDSCAEFESMLKQSKGGSSNSSKAGGMMKSDPAAREAFVNKVAGPLVNKMIDCDLLPPKQ